MRIGVGQGTGQHAGLGRPLTVPAHSQPPHCVTRPPPSLLAHAVRTSCVGAESLRGCEGAHVQRGLGGPKAMQPSSPSFRQSECACPSRFAAFLMLVARVASVVARGSLRMGKGAGRCSPEQQTGWESTEAARKVQPRALQQQLSPPCCFARCCPGTLVDAKIGSLTMPCWAV